MIIILLGCIYLETFLNDFVFKYLVRQNIFPSCPSHCDRGFIVVIYVHGRFIVVIYVDGRHIYFQIWNKKQHKIISRDISSHIGPLYIDVPYINGLYLFWDSFEWFFLQIKLKWQWYPLLLVKLEQLQKIWKKMNWTLEKESNHIWS